MRGNNMEYSKTHKIVLSTVSIVFILCAVVVVFLPPLDFKTIIASLILFALGAQGVYSVWAKKAAWLNFIGALP